MRLSEAILLGDSLRKRDPDTFLSDYIGPVRGCALGGAMLARGLTVADWARLKAAHASKESTGIYQALRELWPWLTSADISKIGCDFARVQGGTLTLEQLADYVRSIEPAEPGETVCGEGPNQVTERAELLKVKAEELETMTR